MNASLKKYMITVTEIVISYVKLTASSEENHHAVSISGVCVCVTLTTVRSGKQTVPDGFCRLINVIVVVSIYIVVKIH